jgi:enamine deaminase RidA (YjgF/YER057c/UK114 family)
MIERTIESYPNYKFFITSLPNHLFISASVTNRDINPENAAEEIYGTIARLLSSTSSQLVHERCFGSVGLQTRILAARTRVFLNHNIETNTPITFVEGESCLENKFAGVQIRALKPIADGRVWTIMDQGMPKGRAWNLDGSTFFILHSIDGGPSDQAAETDRQARSTAMFHQAEKLLRSAGASYQDVVRTWIYISDILDWYGEFNAVRNRCYSEYGFLENKNAAVQPEQIYLPASTGIEGRNPSGLPATMDVFAIHRSPGSTIQIRAVHGVKQRSPFRYGSAFSRAVVVEEPDNKLILVSGTASIDEQGKSVCIGDPAAQIRQTLNVISTLISSEDATLQDLCEATVFLKHRQDFPIYQQIATQAGINNMPSVNVVADVCREELLFELDAAFILEKNKTK